MPSKKSKTSRNPRSPSKEELSCTERELEQLAARLASQLSAGDRVILEGPMGAGKTTFARSLLTALGVVQPPAGSPSFAIAHEYDSKKMRARVVHLDFYRIKAEAEIEDAGIPEYFWDPDRIVVCEWLSMWPEFERSVLASGRNWRVKLGFGERAESCRVVEVIGEGLGTGAVSVR